MARKDYFISAAPEPWQILGLTLRPFSVGHYIKLRRLDCAFVADELRPAKLSDLVVGLAVCSMSSHPDPNCDEFWVWYNRPSKTGLVRRAAARLLKRHLLNPAERDLYDLGKIVGAFDFKDKAQLFADYISAHTDSLDYWIEPEKGDEPPTKSGAHWAHAMITTVTGKCGYTLHDAYNVPFGQCLNDYLLEAERSGSIRIMNDDESEFLASAAKAVAT